MVVDKSIYTEQPYWCRTSQLDLFVSQQRTSLRPYLVVSATSAGVSNIHDAKNVPLLVQNEERVHEMHSFDGGSPPPPLSTQADTDIIHVIKWTRPLPSVFAYCQQSKTGRCWERGYILLCTHVILCMVNCSILCTTFAGSGQVLRHWYVPWIGACVW